MINKESCIDVKAIHRKNDQNRCKAEYCDARRKHYRLVRTKKDLDRKLLYQKEGKLMKIFLVNLTSHSHVCLVFSRLSYLPTYFVTANETLSKKNIKFENPV